jgi:hypothetical protein
MPTPSLTIDEWVQTIRRSALPTVVCEGNTDLSVLRFVEQALDPAIVSLLPCGGKDMVLGIYSRRQEFSNARIAYLADKDTWIFNGVPNKYRGIILTWGYCIENDVLDGARIEDLLTPAERVRFQRSLIGIVRWFAFEIGKLQDGGSPAVAAHVDQILRQSSDMLTTRFLQNIGFKEPSSEVVSRIFGEYKRLLNGKTILHLLVRLLSHPTRKSKYQSLNLLEISVKLYSNARITRIIRRISDRLGLTAT